MENYFTDFQLVRERLVVYDIYCPFCSHHLLNSLNVDEAAAVSISEAEEFAVLSMMQVDQHP